MSSSFLASPLISTGLFQRLDERASIDDRIEASYRRARAVAKEYALTAHDVVHLTPKFWNIHMDPVLALDSAIATLVTIQYNLAGGTLAPFAEKRPELRPLMDSIMRFDVSAQFLLTEIGHGLDAPNLETTATLLPNGEIDLHTPNPRACKIMPPTGPFGSIPRVAIVMARLVINGENRGVRPFVVALGNGKEMCKGVSSRLLPQRGGLKAVDHAVTSFHHVRLPATALLGSTAKPADFRTDFNACIWRVSIGSLAIAMMSMAFLSLNTYVAARYSLRRMVTGSNGVQANIISFRTQQLPIMHGIAQLEVIRAHAAAAVALYRDNSLDHRVRSGVAAAAKTSMTEHAWATLGELSERMGAHGVFEHNGILSSELTMRGIRIAEGDVLVLCIRLANELLLGRYEMPKSKHPECLLARHEEGLFAGCRTLLANAGNNHRHESLSRLLLPRCVQLVKAIGHRMAFEAALDFGVPKPLLDLYEAGVVISDSGWYAVHAGLPQAEQYAMEDRAVTAAMPHLEEYLARTGAEPYAAIIPINTQENWDAFVDGLQVYSGNAEVPLIASLPPTTVQVEARL